MLRIAAWLGVAALTALSLQALAEPVRETKTLQPGEFLERNLELQAGARVQWSITVEPRGEEVPYDIHSHEPSGEVKHHVIGLVNTTAEGVFTTPTNGTFSWLVSNAISRRPVQATLETEELGAGAGGNPLPGPDMVLASLAGVLALALLRPRGRAPVRCPRR